MRSAKKCKLLQGRYVHCLQHNFNHSCPTNWIYWINYESLEIFTGTMEKSIPSNNSASSQQNNDLSLRHWVAKFPAGFAYAGCGHLAKCSDVLFCPIDFQRFWYQAGGIVEDSLLYWWWFMHKNCLRPILNLYILGSAGGQGVWFIGKKWPKKLFKRNTCPGRSVLVHVPQLSELEYHRWWYWCRPFHHSVRFHHLCPSKSHEFHHVSPFCRHRSVFFWAHTSPVACVFRPLCGQATKSTLTNTGGRICEHTWGRKHKNLTIPTSV